MLAYPLASGRFAVAHSQYAGTEHTGRGGQRVYTHVAVMDAATYQLFDCNPLTVFAGLHKCLFGNPQLKNDAGLEPLSLPTPRVLEGEPVIAKPGGGRPGSTSPSDVSLVTLLCRAGFEKESCIAFGAENELSLAWQMMLCLPSITRRTLSISVGLKFAPSRQIQFSFVQRDQGDTQRASRGKNIQWLDPKAIPARRPSTFDAWIDLSAKWLSEGRTSDMERLTRYAHQEGTSIALTRCAALCKDIDVAATADKKQAEKFIAKISQLEPMTKVEIALVQQLDECVTASQTMASII